jgi:hypothetical protein
MPNTAIPERAESSQILVFDPLGQEKQKSLFRTISPLSHFHLKQISSEENNLQRQT